MANSASPEPIFKSNGTTENFPAYSRRTSPVNKKLNINKCMNLITYKVIKYSINLK